MRCLLTFAVLFLAAPAAAQESGPPGAVSDDDRADAEVLFDRGKRLFAEGQTDVAEAQFRAALRLDPAHVAARQYLVECLVLLGRVDEAADIARAGQARAEIPPALQAAPQAPAGVDPAPSDLPAAVPAYAPPTTPTQMTDEETAVRRTEAAGMQAEAQAWPTEEAARQEAEGVGLRAEDETLDAGVNARRRGEKAACRRGEKADPQTPEARVERTRRRNPRSRGKLAAAFALGGSTATLGGVFELRPHWLGSLNVGLGGFLVSAAGRGVLGAAAISFEGQLSPIPWRLTPLLGAGVMIVAGPAASAIDAVLWSPLESDRVRVVPYGLIGARYDANKRLWFSLSARVAPSSRYFAVPLPGGRIGLRF